jgi:hypothetical protein
MLRRPAHASRKKSRREPADHHADDLEHQPILQWVGRAGVQVPGVERVVRRVCGAAVSTAAVTTLENAPDAPSPRPMSTNDRSRTTPIPTARDVRARVRLWLALDSIGVRVEGNRSRALEAFRRGAENVPPASE